MILFVDNFDSFSYNLVDLIRRQSVALVVHRNNEIDILNVHKIKPKALVISPGPGKPEQTGNLTEIVSFYLGKIPMLGICLGHQLLAQLLGGTVVRASKPMHGKVDQIQHNGKGLFAGLPQNFNVMRYHSLIVEIGKGNFEISAFSSGGEIMGLSNEALKIEGLQFHPESILSKYGESMIQNWLEKYL